MTNNSYQEDIRHINFLLVCPRCITVGLFHRHAAYNRYLFNSINESITIQRIRCEACGSMHTLLPDIIIPYRYFSSPFILRLFELHLKDEGMSICFKDCSYSQYFHPGCRVTYMLL